jgi:hypothetical protein
MSSFGKFGAYIISNSTEPKNVKDIKKFMKYRKIKLNVSKPYVPKESDLKQMSSYGKYMMIRCRDRFAHEQFSYMSAYGALLAWRRVWKKCAASRKEYFVCFEGNSIIHMSDELENAMDAVVKHGLDLVKLAEDSSEDYCPNAQDKKPETIEKLENGTLCKLIRPKTNAKGYIMSRRFCKHMFKITESGIPPLHVDFLTTMEASPYGPGFKGAEYFPTDDRNYIVTWDWAKKGYKKDQKVNHRTPICYKDDWKVIK